MHVQHMSDPTCISFIFTDLCLCTFVWTRKSAKLQFRTPQLNRSATLRQGSFRSTILGHRVLWTGYVMSKYFAIHPLISWNEKSPAFHQISPTKEWNTMHRVENGTHLTLPGYIINDQSREKHVSYHADRFSRTRHITFFQPSHTHLKSVREVQTKLYKQKLLMWSASLKYFKLNNNKNTLFAKMSLMSLSWILTFTLAIVQIMTGADDAVRRRYKASPPL